MRRKIFALLSIIGLTFAVGRGQQPSANAPSVDRLREIVTYLASDPLDGRRTGTAGATEAATYIAGEFKRLGLRPLTTAITRGFASSIYLQPFPYVSTVELGKNNSLVLTTSGVLDAPKGISQETLRVGDSWIPLGFSTNATIESDALVLSGFGISAPELKYNDYLGVKDRVAVALAGTPDGDNPHGQFAQAGQIRFKAAAARGVGGGALIIITSEKSLNDDKSSRLSYDNAGEAGLPVILVSREAGASLLGGAEALAAFEKAAAARTPSLPVSKSIKLTIDVVRHESPSYNVVGILPGSDSKLKDEAIVIGAHYDHLGRGGEGSLAAREGDIHHGADDNASGTAGLLELARMLSTQPSKPRRTIVFIAFSGEEEGLLGSDFYVNHPLLPLAGTVAMINMDMIGRLQESKLIVGGVGTASDWRSLIASENSAEKMRTDALANSRGSDSPTYHVNIKGEPSAAGYPIVMGANGQPVVTADVSKLSSVNAATPFTLTLNEDGFGPSDHSSFYSKQIPVLFFWTGTHNDYHKPSDTADKINYEGEARIVAFVERIVRDIDKRDKRPTYTLAKSDPQQRTGFRVYLGTIPNYADSNDGLKLDGVRDDSPAAKSGLKAGDKVVKLAGRDVKNVYDYTYALGEMKAGKEYEVEVIRDGKRLTMKITPEARK
jgi:aminopeptidase YwaD